MPHRDLAARVRAINRKYLAANILLMIVASLLIAGFAAAGR